ncbi:site-specific integrase [Bacillus wiedmannii]|uniref:tyrosine-type recombinase/integrase n=1 Tax=Bacillus wiedmannii TaxID=1890302 RepID=UPI0010BDB195|nr:tyrosine-type recombinase/integrase [Bacillus wiedmannii]TKH27686.1 site-specific integrase [Bacillus wiedmannii]
MPKISNIYRDKKSGKWYFVANLGYDEHGQRIQHWKRGFLTQKEAKQAYDEFMNNYSMTAVKMNSTMSYKEFYETYFKPDYKRSVTQRTYENRVLTMDIHFSFFFSRKLKDINAPMMKKWQNKLSENYSSAYIRNIYGLFQKSLDLAVTLGLLQKNIAKQVGNVKKVKKKVDFWTKEEFEKVISTFDISDYHEHFSFITIWLLFMSGLRFGEAQALEWSTDIDFEEKTLTVNKSMYYKNANEFYITEPKTKASNRIIALDENTINLLKEWKKVQSKNSPSKYVLSYNGAPTNRSATFHVIGRHSKLAGVHKIKTHALRHSHASLLISLGENALVVRDRLGHEDIQTTLGTYGHLYPNMNREVANRLTNIIQINTDNKNRRHLISNQYIRRKQNIKEQ